MVTTDKWVVGERFEFVDLVTVAGEASSAEPIHAFIWRVVGAVSDGEFALHDIEARWMGEDACGDDPHACDALMRALGLGVEEL